MSGAPDVWVTRARPGAEATAARLRERGLVPLVAPLLEARPLGVTPDLTGAGALAFTSAAALAALSPRAVERDVPVFAVGDATAEAARRAGFARVESASGDVPALAGLLAQRRDAFDGPVLHLCATEPAGDLPGLALAAGVQVRAVPVYETLALPAPAAVAGAWPALSAVLLHSPKAARAFTAATRGWVAGRARLLCLSAAVAQALGDQPRPVAVAPRPDDAALLNLLDVTGP